MPRSLAAAAALGCLTGLAIGCGAGSALDPERLDAGDPPGPCDDGNPCTSETRLEGQCAALPVADGTPCASGSCRSGQCTFEPSQADAGPQGSDAAIPADAASPPADAGGGVDVTHIVCQDFTLRVGDSFREQLTLTPANATRADVRFTTSTSEVVDPPSTVGGDGISGAISADGVYTAPSTPGAFKVWNITKDPSCVHTTYSTCFDWCVATVVADAPDAGSAAADASGPAPDASGPASDAGSPAPDAGGDPTGEPVAFPGAQGAGAKAVGGRGGKVYVVNTLAGPSNGCAPWGVGTCTLLDCFSATNYGSLRTAADGTAGMKPRTCVFTVSGIIPVTTRQSINAPYLTVAGQSAPGQGIALHVTVPNLGPMIELNTHDVVIRYLRVWGDAPNAGDARVGGMSVDDSYNHCDGATGPCTSSSNCGTGCGGNWGVGGWGGTRKTILDHLTTLWGTTENYSFNSGGGQVTVQWGLMGEGLQPTEVPYGDTQNVSTCVNCDSYRPDNFLDFDFHHNIIATTKNRNPSISTASARLQNNLIANVSRGMVLNAGGHLDLIGNYFRPGAGFYGDYGYAEINTSSFASPSDFSIYFHANRSDWAGPRPTASGPVLGLDDAADWDALVCGNSGFQSQCTAAGGFNPMPRASAWRATPLCDATNTASCTAGPGSPGPAIAFTPVSSVPDVLTDAVAGAGVGRLLSCDGSWRPIARDSAEIRILAYVVNGNGPDVEAHNITRVNDGYGLPSLSGGSPCPDQNGNGIPDGWEAANCPGGTATSCGDGSEVQPDGYTWLERYLNGR